MGVFHLRLLLVTSYGTVAGSGAARRGAARRGAARRGGYGKQVTFVTVPVFLSHLLSVL